MSLKKLIFELLVLALVLAACTAPSPTPTADPNLPKIVFSSTRKGNNNLEIYTMDIAGNGVARLTNETTTDGSPNWSPDGSKIVFHSKREGNFDIYIMNADGSNLVKLVATNGDDKDPCWSPDGKRIAFHSNRDGYVQLFVVNTDGTGLDKIENDLMTAESYSPVWSPDGNQMIFYSNSSGNLDIYKMDLAVIDIIDENTFDYVGNNVVRLTDSRSDEGSAAWSPDGSEIAFQSDRSGAYEIYIMDANGENETILTETSDGHALRPSWSGDGQQLVFSNLLSDNEKASLYIINRDGTGLQQITNGNWLDAAPSWQP